MRAPCDGCPCVFHIGRRTASGYARASGVAQNSRRGARIHIDNRHIASYVAVSSSRPDRPPLRVAQRGALLHHVAPGHGVRRVLVATRLRLDADLEACSASLDNRRLSTTTLCADAAACDCVGVRSRPRCAERRQAITPDCPAHLGPVKAFRADYRYAPTPDGAVGLDRPFGRAGTWLLRDGPPATDVGESRLRPRAAALDAVVAFVRILLEWDDRARKMVASANTGAADDDRGERIESHGAVCAGVE